MPTTGRFINRRIALLQTILAGREVRIKLTLGKLQERKKKEMSAVEAVYRQTSGAVSRATDRGGDGLGVSV